MLQVVRDEEFLHTKINNKDVYVDYIYDYVVLQKISQKINMLDKHVFPYDMEGLFVELNFRKCKWLLFGTYHPPSQADIYYFDNLDKAFDT